MITYSCPAKGTRDRNRNRVQGRFAVEGLEERALMALAVESIRTTEGVPFSGIVATLLRSDINNADPVSCAARIVWGDGTDSLALVRSDPAAPMGAALQVVTQSPHDFPDVGSYPVTVSVTCGDTTALFAAGSATVAPRPLVLAAVPLVAVSGETFVARAVARFRTADADDRPADFEATVTVGQTAPAPATVIQNASGEFEVRFSGSFLQTGAIAATVRVIARDGASGTVNAEIAIERSPIQAAGQDVALIAGAAPSSQVLAIFTDTRADAQAADYQAFVTLPSQPQSLATVQRLSDGRFAVSAPTAVATAGQFTVPVRVVRVSDGLAATATATLRADRIPINAIGQAVAVIAGAGPATRDLVVFLDGRANASAAEFQAIVTFPDQSQRLGTVRALSGGRFAVSAPVGASQAGESAVQVRITRTSDGQTAIVDALIQAANPIAPAIDLPAPGGIVRVRQFRIQGSSPSGSVILLYAQRLGQPVSEQIGRTVADASGRWSVRVGPLANGRYVIRALIAPPGQSPFEIALAGPGGETTPLTVASAKLKPHGPGRGRPIR